MKVWIVVATWVWWTAVAGAAWAWPLMVEDQHTLRYEVVRFPLIGAGRDNYTEFMGALRRQLASVDERHGIPVMREPSTVPDAQRYLLVEISNWAERSVTLAVDVTNAYVVAYRAGDQSYFFGDSPASPDPFPGTVPFMLPFNTSYPSLERVAEANREDIELGLPALGSAITSLRLYSSVHQRVARALLVATQMVSEAARFRYIEQLVRQSISRESSYISFHPDASMISLENNWGALSSAVQQSNQGVFSSPVQLQRPDNSFFNVDSVTNILVANLAFMVFICRDRASQFSPLIRSVIATDEDDETCSIPEPTVRISGRSGLCVDVKGANYSNGNPIILWACKSDTQLNQLWTLKRDGTIRSNGKCLTTNGYSPGDYVMIYDCATADTDATSWQVWGNGTIINPHSTLVLSAKVGNGVTTLTVQDNIYAYLQGWVASNNTKPFVTSIVGFQDLCLSLYAPVVWLEKCSSNKTEQQWALYPDGSIRPQQIPNGCLTCRSDSAQAIVDILACSLTLSRQRWVFRNDGTIMNLQNGLVMEAKAFNQGRYWIFIQPPTGNPKQKWLPLP